MADVPDPKPTVRRMVCYGELKQLPTGEHITVDRAAVVTEVYDGGLTVALTVFKPDIIDLVPRAAYSPHLRAGFWSWPVIK